MMFCEREKDIRKNCDMNHASSWVPLHDWPVQKLAKDLIQGTVRSYDVFLDEVLDVVEVTSLGNCVVVVAVRKLLPDFRL
jgi:hypothetical protein